MRLEIAAPDLNVSGGGFTPQGDGIRFGLNAIKNLGESAVRSLLQARESGRFRDLDDFCQRVSGKALNKRVLESLIKAGALDSFGSRAGLMAAAERALEAAQREEKARQQGQHGLFLDFEEAAPPSSARLPVVAEWDEATRLAGEKEVLGYYVSGHPMDRFGDRCADLRVVALEDVDRHARGRQDEIQVAGILSQLQVRRNKKGEAWATAWLEDRTSRRELLIFAEAYRRLEPQLHLTQPVLARVRVLAEDSDEEGKVAESKLQVMEIGDLVSAPVPQPLGLKLRLALDGLSPEALERLIARLAAPSGSAKLHVHAYSEAEQFEQILEVEAGVAADTAFRRLLEEICGRGSVRAVEG